MNLLVGVGRNGPLGKGKGRRKEREKARACSAHQGRTSAAKRHIRARLGDMAGERSEPCDGAGGKKEREDEGKEGGKK